MTRQDQRLLLLPGLLALLVVVVWWPSLAASFQFDDWAVVVKDPRVQSLAAWWQSMPGMRALLKLSYALNHEADAGVVGFRAVNIGLHALNTLLVFTLLHGLGRGTLRLDRRSALLAAAVAALVFGLHPVQTEAVTYISGRSNALMATCVLLCLAAWSRRADAARPWLWTFASLFALAAALAAKETAAVTPLALMLWGLMSRGANLSTVLRATLPHWLLVVLALFAGLLWMPYASLLATSLGLRMPWTNLIAQADGVVYLAGQLVFFTRLNADPLLAVNGPLNPTTLLAVATLIALLVIGFLNLRRDPAIAFGILWFFLWLAPTNSLLARLDLANDRQLYLAIIGPAWLLGIGLARVSDGITRHLPAGDLGAIALLALTLTTGTLLRNRVYATELAFWQDVAAKSPLNARAANNLGIAHALACQPLAARAEFARAAAIDPQDPRAAINAQLVLRGELPGQPADAECR